MPGHDHRRTRLALRLFAAAAADARTLTVLIRRAATAPLAFATAVATLATAARGLAEPADERPAAAIAAALDEAEVALFETARPSTPPTEALARALVHLQRLLRELSEGTLDYDAALERARPTRRGGATPPGHAVLTGLITGVDTGRDGTGIVTLIDSRGQGAGTTAWGHDGAFRLTAPTGLYTLLVTAPGHSPIAQRSALHGGVQRTDVDLTPSAPPNPDAPTRTAAPR